MYNLYLIENERFASKCNQTFSLEDWITISMELNRNNKLYEWMNEVLFFFFLNITLK